MTEVKVTAPAQVVDAAQLRSGGAAGQGLSVRVPRIAWMPRAAPACKAVDVGFVV